MQALFAGQLRSVAVLGAHCDDICIGTGATLLALCEAHPGLRVDALVLTGSGTPREAEERAAVAAFCPAADVRLTVLDLPDGGMPAHWQGAKQALRTFRAELGENDPGLVFAPAARDAHQDHRVLASLVPTEFRAHTALGYEILKWESDLSQPSVFAPVEQKLARRKVDLLHTHYPSQLGKSWFDEESFLGLMRVRGVQCGARYAEGFHGSKIVLGTGRVPDEQTG